MKQLFLLILSVFAVATTVCAMEKTSTENYKKEYVRCVKKSYKDRYWDVWREVPVISEKEFLRFMQLAGLGKYVMDKKGNSYCEAGHLIRVKINGSTLFNSEKPENDKYRLGAANGESDDDLLVYDHEQKKTFILKGLVRYLKDDWFMKQEVPIEEGASSDEVLNKSKELAEEKELDWARWRHQMALAAFAHNVWKKR